MGGKGCGEMISDKTGTETGLGPLDAATNRRTEAEPHRDQHPIDLLPYTYSLSRDPRTEKTPFSSVVSLLFCSFLLICGGTKRAEEGR